MDKYHFGVPGVAVWLSHILSGLLLVYVGYMTLNKKSIPQVISIILIVTGCLAGLYHAHIWFINL